MPLLETEIEALVIAWADDHGWLSPKLQWVGQTGWPDRTFIKNGSVVFIEFKRPKGGVRARKQVYWLKRLKKQGCNAFFVNNAIEGIEILKSFDNG